MSRTRKGSKGSGYEYWSKRPMAGANHGAKTKRLTHKLERLEAKQDIEEQVADHAHADDCRECQEIDEALYCHHYGPCQSCQDRNLEVEDDKDHHDDEA